MAKLDPHKHVAALEARLAELRKDRDDRVLSISQAETTIGTLIANDPDDLEFMAELRSGLAIDRQRLPELEAAIPIVEAQLEDARAEAVKAEQQRSRRAAWDAANKRAKVAAAIDAKLAEVGTLWAELTELTNAENAAARAAGGSAGTSMTMANRLKAIVPCVLWRHLGAMLAAARFEHIPSTRWATLESFIRSPAARTDADAA